MCGIIGLIGQTDVNQLIYDGLTVLQHRGQDAAGIVTFGNGKFWLRKDRGMVRDVFRTRHMIDLKGNMGIGHVRYPTAGAYSIAEAQPFYVNSPYGLILAHNGNLTNATQLSRQLYASGLRHINTQSDSEVLLNVLAEELQKSGKLKISHDDIFTAVEQVHKRCQGAYAVVSMIAGYGLLAFRDPYGIRPVCFGKRETANGTEYVVASESVAIDTLGFEFEREIEPGEAVFIDNDGRFFARQCVQNPVYSPCLFEYVYLARPDSIIDDVYVYKARLRMGEKLAKKILRQWSNHDIDVVIPIPDTSRTAALQLSYMLKVVYREGFIKNRYIGRTFIMPGQKLRQKSVHQKLNAIDLEFKGKNVLLVDDSIVRGTTSKQIIQMAREAGAKKVYFASAAPPVRYPNVYGIDMPSVKELVGHDRSEREIADVIGADRLIFQELQDLIDAVKKGNPKIQRFEACCFNNEYVTGDINQAYLDNLAGERDNAAVENMTASTGLSGVDLHNTR